MYTPNAFDTMVAEEPCTYVLVDELHTQHTHLPTYMYECSGCGDKYQVNAPSMEIALTELKKICGSNHKVARRKQYQQQQSRISEE